jgi:hypothetical protein
VPGVVGRHLLLRIQAVSHEVRTMVETETSYLVRAASAVVEHVHVHEPAHVNAEAHLDDTAGGEFVDDRIRELD